MKPEGKWWRMALVIELANAAMFNAARGGCELWWLPFISGGQTGVNGAVGALTVWNGDLIAGGAFTTAGGQTVNRIARWDHPSSTWLPFTSGGQTGVSGAVRALTVWNDNLVAGGAF